MPFMASAATTYNIASTAMASTNGDGLCTLTEAIESARTNATVNECVSAGGPYTINLQSNATYTATTIGNVDGQFGNSAFLWSGGQPLTINGNGSTISQSGQAQRIFLVSAGNLTLRNLTLSGGAATDGATAIGPWGGAILAAYPGTVVSLEDVTVSNNQATVDGGAFLVAADAVMNLHRTTLTNNTAVANNGHDIRITQNARMNVANATLVSSNSMIAVTDNEQLLVSNAFVSGPSVLVSEGTAAAEVQNSILVGFCSNSGIFVSTNNSSDVASCLPVRSAPTLGALSDNGGATRTRLPNASKDAAQAARISARAPIHSSPTARLSLLINEDLRATQTATWVPVMTFSPASLPDGTFGTPYSATISVTAWVAPVSLAVTAGSMPPGLSFNPGTGVISGTPAGVTTASFTVTATDSDGFNSDYRYSIAIVRANQTITFNTQSTTSRPFVSAGTFAIDPLATASSGLTSAYSSGTPTVCTVSGTMVTMVSAGTCTLRANLDISANYNAAAQVTQDVTITQGPQTLTFGAQSAQTFAAGGTFAINPLATASSGLVATYSSLTTGVCTVSGTTVTMVSAGTCTVAANQGGDANYNAAAQVTADVTINPGPQVISFAALPARTLGTAPFTVTATGGASGNPVILSSLTPTVCTATGANGSLITLLLPGTCMLRANQAAGGSHAAATPVDQGFLIGTSATVMSISAAAGSTSYGAPATFTATVNGVNVGGTVTFYDGLAPICSRVPVTNGTAQCTVSNLAEGGHSISATFAGDANNSPAQSDVIVHVVPKVGIHQGVWWGGAAQNGWGLSVFEHGDIMAAAWYHFDASGKPVWLLMPGCSWNATKTVCTGSLQRTRASWFGNFRTSTFTGTRVGSMTLRFTDADRGRMEFLVDGVAGSKDIERMNIGGNPSAPFDYTDIWWGGQTENGWGVSVHQADNALVGVWYTYDAAGEPTWMLFNSGAWVNTSTFRAVLFRPTGSPMVGATYDVSTLRTPVVGEFYLQFKDNNSAEMSYFVDNILQARNITKMRF